MKQNKRALISVADKTNLIEFANNLVDLGYEIIATGGTYKHLKEQKIEVTEVETVTGFPEILDGRVKTLHPKISGAILANIDKDTHRDDLVKQDITPIDLVCVNLYPFIEVTKNPGCSVETAIENIDIGGVTLIRAASKNYNHVTVVTNINDYQLVIDEIKTLNKVSNETRLALAQKGFLYTAYYDSVISEYFKSNISNSGSFTETLTVPLKLRQQLRYGENSGQMAALYVDNNEKCGLLASFKQLQGKELSYNNLIDADTAWECVRQLESNACVIVKHANPCGVAMGSTTSQSYEMARNSDPVSSFGGIVAFNAEVDEETAISLAKQFIEVVIAPQYTEKSLAILSKKTNLRVLQIDNTTVNNQLEYKTIGGGVLVQTTDTTIPILSNFKQVTSTILNSEQESDLLLAWKVAKYVKSNAIVLVKDGQTIGIGAGQMSRVDSVKIALSKAKEFGFDTNNSVCASDAFFPFRDNIDLLAQGGVKTIIQPGGSVKDDEVIEAASEHDITMLLTNHRVFRH